MSNMRRRAHPAVAIVVLALVCGALAPAPRGDAGPGLSIEAVSNRADLVSGGDVLVRVGLPSGVRAADAVMRRNGRVVPRALHASPSGYLARLEGLRLGRNAVSVSARGSTAVVEVTNHPIGGPVIAGPQVQPWICRSQELGLGPPTDAQCNTRRVYELKYRSRFAPIFLPWSTHVSPLDVATTTTDQRKRVPYIVRIERGVMDRAVYEIAVLHDPSKAWAPWAPQDGFNGKVVVPFGGGCQPRHSQAPPSDVMDDAALSRGFAVMSSGMHVPGQNCNDVVSAEALMMLKEHFIETYGPIRYTIGNGWSGGSMQQLSIASNYPGLLDGIQPAATFSDIWEAVLEAEDCFLLDRYFETAPLLWPVDDQTAVSGYVSPTSCRSLWDTPGTNGYARTWLDPDNPGGCVGDIAGGISDPTKRPSYVYDARMNPRGTRCTVQDYMVSVFGRRRSDGFASRPFDNVGVQYGLVALQNGVITAEQFVDLNERIGGIDIDWEPTRARSVADQDALRVAYRSGRVTSMREAARVPIIDMPLQVNGEIHQPFHSDVVRERLRKANGRAGNHVMWSFLADSFPAIDRWLGAIEADLSDRPLAEKVVRNRPKDLVDACGLLVQVSDPAICGALFPHYADPRIAAGGPLSDDVLKCALKPLGKRDYARVRFTPRQWSRLQRTFPSGVCDYTKRPVGWSPSVPWLTFADGPGGEALGPPPASHVVR